VSDACTDRAGEYDYEQWNAEVHSILKNVCPGLHTEYFTQLGGGCQANVVGKDAEAFCVVITDDCIGSYPVTAKDWDNCEEDSDDDYPLQDYACVDAVVTPLNACCIALTLLFAPLVDMEVVRALSAKEVWDDAEMQLAAMAYPGILVWHAGSSFPYYILSRIRQAIKDDAPPTAIYHDGRQWHTFENVAAKTTGKLMLSRLYSRLMEAKQ
jgi:hypothetical protein